jgi:type VII secretion protein EccB
MASKRDLVEAQSYSRRRLLTAFVSGAPQGQELEPTKPMRGVVAGVMLTVLLVLGSLAWGVLKPTLPGGWDDNRLVVVKNVGTRYLAVKGTLYPVLNTTSARLTIPSSSFDVVQVSAHDIAKAPRGATVGILGAPDSPPDRKRLVATGWQSCVAGGGQLTGLGTGPTLVEAAGKGVLVTAGNTLALVANGRRYEIPSDHRGAVLRAVGFETATPLPVTGAWLSLFPQGADLAPVSVDHAGERPSDAGLPADVRVGTVLHVSDGARTQDYVVTVDGLAPISAFALPLYALGNAQAGDPVPVSSAAVAAVGTAKPLEPGDWPAAAPHPLPTTPCARLTTGAQAHVDLMTTTARPAAPGVAVAPGGGALVVARTTADGAGTAALVDETGTAFGLPDASDEVLARLGYLPDDRVTVPPAWVALLAAGPELTEDAAKAQVSR